jgi:L-threonylcarbamoyladenylate synthase
MSRVIAIDPAHPDLVVLADAAAALHAGKLVAFPTETVYGLGARGLIAEDVARIFVAKGRPSAHPIILHVEDEAMARSLAREWTETAAAFVKAFWPGPLTLVVPRASNVPDAVTGGMETVGLRAPNHPIALGLIRAARTPLAAPSANAHTHVSPTTAAHVIRSLGDRVDLILDGGPCRHGIESTVVSLVDDHQHQHDSPRVLRPGAISLEQLRAIDPRTEYEAITIDQQHTARAAPGMAAKHYAPRAKVKVVATRDFEAAISELGDTRAAATTTTATAAATATNTAAIVRTDAAHAVASRMKCTLVIRLPDQPDDYARQLFAALHSVDETEASAVVIEAAPEADSAWWAIRDRLARAAR